MLTIKIKFTNMINWYIENGGISLKADYYNVKHYAST